MSKGRIGIVGAGPGGMATALAAIRLGYDVQIFERACEIKPAGNILNLWPPPQKVLKLIGVDVSDLGAACHTVFANAKGKVRADVLLPPEVVSEYGGGFIGLLRWGLYKRMIEALPEGVLCLGHQVNGIEDLGDRVRVDFAGQPSQEFDILVGADGLHSFVRKWLWGDSPIRRQFLHLIGGYLFLDEEGPAEGVVAHDATTQFSYTPIRHEGKWGYEWWVLEAFKEDDPIPTDFMKFAKDRVTRFSPYLQSLVDQTPVEHMQRWEIRDRPPLKQWSKGRVTLVGDAAHPTSPYAAYGAGMSIEDGYFLARHLSSIDLKDTGQVRGALQAFEERRKPHTATVTETAYKTGRMFHHLPKPLRPLRDFVFDKTPFLQKMIGNDTPKHILSQLAEIEDA